MMAKPATGQIVERHGTRGTTYGARFCAYGKRRYVTLGVATHADAQTELENILADVRRGIWREPASANVVEARREEPTFHVFASEYVESRRIELKVRSIEDLEWALSNHLLPFFKDHALDAITAAGSTATGQPRSASARTSTGR